MCGDYGTCRAVDALRYECDCLACWNGRRCNIPTVSQSCAPPPPAAAGVTVPTSSAGDFDAMNGASTSAGPKDKETSGANLRTGGPGQTSLIHIGSGLLAPGHSIATLSMSFRYVAGYTPAAGQSKKAPVVKVVLLDMESSAVLKTVFTSQPLGAYSYDHFTQYSPPVEVKATGIGVPNSKKVVLALQVENNERNLQIPIDDLAQGFDCKVTWTASEPAQAAAFQPEARFVPGFEATTLGVMIGPDFALSVIYAAGDSPPLPCPPKE